jgi:hypothetical protein
MLFESPESPRSLFDQNQDGELPEHIAILRNIDMLNTGIGALSATNMADDEEGYTFEPCECCTSNDLSTRASLKRRPQSLVFRLCRESSTIVSGEMFMLDRWA